VDTRSKILTSADSLPRPFTLVSGYFDVLRAEHVREFERVRQRTVNRPLVVVVLRCPEELLSQRARAELVAAVRVVDYVVTADHNDLSGIIERLQPAEVVRLEEADRRRTGRLIEHVQRGQTR
jgi:glycerol-3-phosphate cytidylyltransferase-like family protein